MIVKNVTFVKSAVKAAHYPPADLPEVAFVGRSNVGKSSLINVLVNRKNLVRTSSMPGRTQLLNFFLVNDAFMLVDLPGYGFAKAPLAVRKQWGPMMEAYFASRTTLRGVVLILDVRRVPSADDARMLGLLRAYGIQPLLVVTKCDKVSKNERRRQAQVIATTLQVDEEELLFFSALAREGTERIWAAIGHLLELQSV